MWIINRQFSSLALSICLVCAGAASAWAEEPSGAPEQAEEAGHAFEKVSQTQPVAIDDRVSRDIATMGVAATQGEANPARSGAVQRFFGEAFGAQAFSGEATSDDIWALNAGLMIGMLPYAAKYQPQSYQASVEWLTQHQEFTSKLDDEVSGDFARLTGVLESGEAVSFMQVQELYNAAFEQLRADADSRIHGYLAAGIWAALSYVDRAEGIGSYSLALTGDTLEFLFRQNAKEGSTDFKVADAIAAIADELEKREGGDKGAVVAAIGQIRSVK